jgi:glycosyltransferase involved in cell wall biosynthesis
MINALGIQNVMAPDPYGLLLGYPDEHMAHLYNAFDVLLSVSMGEGFSMTPLESQACGTPVIVGMWTATEELLFGGWGVEKADSEPYWTGLNAWQRLPHAQAIKNALDESWRGDRAMMGRLGVIGAQQYDADAVTTNFWKPFLESVDKAVQVNNTIMAASAENGGKTETLKKLNGKLAAA